MGCRLSVNNVYEATIEQCVIDDPRKQPLAEMEFADPASVDGRASNPQSRGILMFHGYPVDPETAPKKFLWNGKNRQLPDILHSQQVMVACDRFRLLVEEFEPGVHQFIPVDIYKSKNSDPVATYFWFNICARLNTVDFDRTTYLRQPGHGGAWYWTNTIWEGQAFREIDNAKIVFDDSKAGASHLWVEEELLAERRYNCSDAFGAAASRANFQGLNVTPRSALYICRSIDRALLIRSGSVPVRNSPSHRTVVPKGGGQAPVALAGDGGRRSAWVEILG